MYLINNIFIAKFNTAATIVVFPIILVSLYAVNIPPIKDDKLEKYVAIINIGTYLYASEKSFFIKNENINGKSAMLPKTTASKNFLNEL